MTYAEKLKDPRWQKKRLKIFERDKFRCQGCGDDENTLHVHHRIYFPGNPWETPNEFLITLCESCHSWQTENMPGRLQELTHELKKHFFSGDIIELTKAFSDKEKAWKIIEFIKSLS